MISHASRQRIEGEFAKYPPEQKRSAVLEALKIVQEEHGWLSQPLMDEVAALLELRPIEVYEVATFYVMFDREPVGRHKICVCRNISCRLRGADTIIAHLKRRLGVGLGETTADGRFTLRTVECLAACGGAPMFQIGKDYYENLTPEKVDDILASLQ